MKRGRTHVGKVAVMGLLQRHSGDKKSRIRTTIVPDVRAHRMTSEPNTFVGEVLFRNQACQELPPDKSVLRDSQSTADEPQESAVRALQIVGECESELRSFGMTFSYRDGTFTFSTIIACEDGAVEIAEQLLQQHALTFLNTLGPFTYNG